MIRSLGARLWLREPCTLFTFIVSRRSRRALVFCTLETRPELPSKIYERLQSLALLNDFSPTFIVDSGSPFRHTQILLEPLKVAGMLQLVEIVWV